MFKVVELKNGFKLVIHRRTTDTIGIALGINVGSIYENSNLRGISHLMEHLFFRGIENTDLLIEGLGAESDAYTDRDVTMYLFEVIPENVKELIDLIYKLYTIDKYSEKDFEKEKNIVLSELRIRNGDPNSKILDIGPLSIFGKSDYGDPVIGYEETVTNISLIDIIEFKRRYYTPQNSILAMVGPINEDVEKYVIEKFSSIESSEEVRKKTPYAQNILNEIKLELSNIDSAYLTYAWRVNYSCDRYDMVIKSTLLEFHLGIGFSSLLIERIRKEYGLSYLIDVERQVLDGGLAYFQIIISSVDLDKIELVKQLVSDVIDKLRRSELPENYLQKRYQFLKYVLRTNIRRVLSIADLEAYLVLKGMCKSIDDYNRDVELRFREIPSDLISLGVWSYIIPKS